jgi:hypothetical protein
VCVYIYIEREREEERSGGAWVRDTGNEFIIRGHLLVCVYI